eukprot:4069164-Amphidinium_carterae.1
MSGDVYAQSMGMTSAHTQALDSALLMSKFSEAIQLLPDASSVVRAGAIWMGYRVHLAYGGGFTTKFTFQKQSLVAVFTTTQHNPAHPIDGGRRPIAAPRKRLHLRSLQLHLVVFLNAAMSRAMAGQAASYGIDQSVRS